MQSIRLTVQEVREAEFQFEFVSVLLQFAYESP